MDWELMGSKAYRHGDWKIVQTTAQRGGDAQWRLFNVVVKDFGGLV